MSFPCRSPVRAQCASGLCASPARRPGCATRSSPPSRPPASLRAPLLASLESHLDEVTHLLELTFETRRDWFHDDVLMMLEPDRLERCAHAPRMPDASPDLLDPYGTRFGKVLFRRLSWPLTRMPHECSWH